jgi:hypothetical protein
MPTGLRRLFVLLVTLTWCGAIQQAQPMHRLTDGILALSALLGLWLCAMPRAASGQLCWQPPHWMWHPVGSPSLSVRVVTVIDVGRLLCLRISPSHAPHRPAWRWPQWVWLLPSDPVSWKELRLALNDAPTIERRSR